jgi:site-specific DNA-methyltransferase (adenine-specific)
LALLVPYFEEMELELRQQILVDKGMRSVTGRLLRITSFFRIPQKGILFIIKDNKKFLKPFLKKDNHRLAYPQKRLMNF